MAKNTTFGKNQIVELIEILKKEGVSSTSFYELAQNMDTYIPNHNKSLKQLISTMRGFSKLFEEILMLSFLDLINSIILFLTTLLISLSNDLTPDSLV